MLSKILFIQDSLGTGGAERANADLWYFLRSNSISPVVIVLRKRSEGVESEVRAQGIQVHLLNGKKFLEDVRSIRNIIKIERPQVVHSVLMKSSFRARIATLNLSIPLVESLVNLTYDRSRFMDPKVSPAKLKLIQFADAVSSRRVDRFHAITQTTSSHYQKYLSIPKQRIEVIYRGVTSNPFRLRKEMERAALNKEFGIGDETFLILNIGRQEFQKGQILLVEAARILRDEFGKTAFKVLIVGRNGTMTGPIKSYVTKHHLHDLVETTGHRYDVKKLLACTDLFVFPSYFEGLGVSLIEAMAAQAAIVCTDIPVFKEISTSQVAQFFISGSADDLARSISKLWNDPQLRKRQGLHAFNHFRENFSQQTVHNNMLSFYKRISGCR